MYKSVVIALDGSEAAAKAIPQGVDIAREFQAKVVLVRALKPEAALEALGSEPDPQSAEFSTDVLGRRDYASFRSQAEGYMASVKRSIREIEVETRIEDGDPAEVITAVANSMSQPVIVITPFGRSASLSLTANGVFGRVADQVLQRSKCPVLVAKS